MAGPKKRADLTVDFSGVESGGRAVADGQYLLEVVSIEEKESQDGNPYLAWKWKVADGTFKGATIYDNTSLKPTALWRLKSLLECLGIDVSDGKMGLNLASYKGLKTLANVANETYQGKQKPRITDFVRGIPSNQAAPVTTLKKGMTVTFDYEGSAMKGTVASIDGDTVVVSVEVDGQAEEWELAMSEVEVDVPY